MKQIVYYLLAIAFFVSSCDKRDQEILEKEKVENPNTNVEEKEVKLEQADIFAYYGFDKTKDVSEAIKAVNTVKGSKNINKKKVDITEAVVSNLSVENGSFSLKIQATVNDKAFSGEYAFDGFKKQHDVAIIDDYNIGRRGYGKWKVEKQVYLKEFKFEDLYLFDKVDEFTADYLKQYVAFYASNPDGETRELLDSEISALKINNLRYSNNKIYFRTVYKEVKSDVETVLEFNISEYYSLKIGITKDFTKNKYMRGVYEHLDYYINFALDFDKQSYATTLTNKSQSGNENSLSLSFNFEHQKSDELEVQIFKEITGFKPLSDLKNDLQIASSYDLEKFLERNLKDKTEEKTLEYLKSVTAWTRHLKFYLERYGKMYELFWGDSFRFLSRDDNAIKDVYLDRPRFSVKSAKYSEKDLIIELQLTEVNEVVLSDITFEIKAVGVKK